MMNVVSWLRKCNNKRLFVSEYNPRFVEVGGEGRLNYYE